MCHAVDDSEQTETERDLEERPEHACHRGAVGLTNHLVEKLSLLSHLVVLGLVTLLHEINSLLETGILLGLVQSGTELDSADLRVEHDGT